MIVFLLLPISLRTVSIFLANGRKTVASYSRPGKHIIKVHCIERLVYSSVISPFSLLLFLFIQIGKFPPWIKVVPLNADRLTRYLLSSIFCSRRNKQWLHVFTTMPRPLHSPKGVKVVNVLKRRVHVAETGHVLLGGPPAVPLENRGEHLEEVLLSFALWRHRVVECGVNAVEGPPLHRVRQDFYCWVKQHTGRRWVNDAFRSHQGSTLIRAATNNHFFSS